LYITNIKKKVLQKNNAFCQNTLYLQRRTVMVHTMFYCLTYGMWAVHVSLLAFIPLWMFSDMAHILHPHTAVTYIIWHFTLVRILQNTNR